MRRPAKLLRARHLLTCAIVSALSACGSADPEPAASPDAGPPAADSGAAPDAAPDTGTAAPVDAGPPKRIFTKRFVVNVRSGPSREATRVGYLRAGSVFQAKTAEPVSREGCRGGWYELETGGFVCAGRDVIVFTGRRLPAIRARQPRLADNLPYQYGYVRRRVPMYRRLPTDEEAAQYEGYRIPGAAPADAGAGAADAGAPTAAPSAMSSSAMGPSAMGPSAMSPSAMSPSAMSPSATGAGESSMVATNTVSPGNGTAEEGTGAADLDAGVETLDDLAGDPDSVVMRWVNRGFFVSLDRDFRRGARRYWRTQANGFIPYRAVVVRDGSEYVGVSLAPPLPEAEPGAVTASSGPTPGADAGAAALGLDQGSASAPAASDDGGWRLPVGWVLSSRSNAYTLNEQGRLRRARRKPGYHHAFRVRGRQEIRGRAYYVGHDQQLYRESDVTVAEASEPPAQVPEGAKWFDIDLTRQVLVAYEGRTPVYATLISSGRIEQEGHPDLDHRTPTGVFQIQSKHLTHTMDGDNAIDGPYSIDDVPYVMYFQLAFALHSAFWHNAFGRPKSHGCINLSPPDARHLFNWAGPALPTGWHGVYPTEDNPASWVRIRGETPYRGRRAR